MNDRPKPATTLLAAFCALVAACAGPQGPAHGEVGPVAGAPLRLRLMAAESAALAGPMQLAECTPTPPPGPSSPSYGTNAIVSGIVYDPAGEPADGALVFAHSLDASVPYSATATTVHGAWVINNIPVGANVALFATNDIWITTRHEIGLDNGRRNTIELRAEPFLPLPE